VALVVEDGTGLANAESYASVAEADAYHADRGNAAWAALATAVKEQALRKATEYMSQAYRIRWAGFRVKATQALDWPRAWVPLIDTPSPYGPWANYVPNNVVPVEAKRACMEYALVASAGAITTALARATLREKIGDIEVEYDPTSPEYTRYRALDMLLAPFLTGSSISVGLVRA
jgi:hypothetical protein